LERKEYIHTKGFTIQVAGEVFQRARVSATFYMTAFTGVIVDIFCKSGDRKEKVTFHDWLLLLLSFINIKCVHATPCSTHFQGDMNIYRLNCYRCDVTFGEASDLVSVLGGAASAIMDHYGFGFDWKELHARAKADMDHFESVFNDLGPTLFSSSKELLNHIERNGLHEHTARKIPLCTCATVSTDNDSKDTSRSEEHQEFENSFKMSVMCASKESGDKIVHYCTSAVIHLLFEYVSYAHDLYENTHDLSHAIEKHDYDKVED